MLKVNVEAILKDYESLMARKELGVKEIEEDARALAVARGYGEEKIKQFIDYVKGFGDNGLSEKENKKISFLEEYIEEVEELEDIKIENTNESIEEKETEIVENEEQQIYNPIELSV